jgi:hypothetical protein
MVSNEEIRTKLELKRSGLDPDTGLETLLEMQNPHEWVGNVCVFNFSSMSIENLSIIVKRMFEVEGYYLEEGTALNGVYSIGSPLKSLLYQFINVIARRYKFRVEIYSEGGETFLKISKALGGLGSAIFYGYVYWQVYYNDTFNRIMDTLKYLRPDEGYMVCDSCGGYYKLQPGESPDDFDMCQCGGKLEYYPSIEPYKREQVKPKLSITKIFLLIFGVGVVIIYFLTPIVFKDYSPPSIYILLVISLALVLSAIYTLFGAIKYILKVNT